MVQAAGKDRADRRLACAKQPLLLRREIGLGRIMDQLHQRIRIERLT
jgi:hypothetical protein